jgi:hypothetical protein
MLRTIIEIGFGLLYLVGALFNYLYTLRHGEEFYGSFAQNALLGPSRKLVQSLVIPHSTIFTSLLIVFQLLVAFCILSRGTLVVPGLIAGAIFSFSVVLVSNIPGASANLLMAIVQVYLAFTR